MLKASSKKVVAANVGQTFFLGILLYLAIGFQCKKDGTSIWSHFNSSFMVPTAAPAGRVRNKHTWVTRGGWGEDAPPLGKKYPLSWEHFKGYNNFRGIIPPS